jgi:hypothetical protein
VAAQILVFVGSEILQISGTPNQSLTRGMETRLLGNRSESASLDDFTQCVLADMCASAVGIETQSSTQFQGVRGKRLNRFPALTEDQLTEADSCAYGGTAAQDLGYCPFGSTEFSNLVHSVRSGDFVRELRVQSQDSDGDAILTTSWCTSNSVQISGPFCLDIDFH